MRRRAIDFLSLSIFLFGILGLTSCIEVPIIPTQRGLTHLTGESSPLGYLRFEAPAPYANTKSPFTVTDQAALTDGKDVYNRSWPDGKPSCVQCHGIQGRGNGEMAPYLDQRPADFAASTTLETLRNHQDYAFWRVSEGLPQTSMPAWKEDLSETERWQVITYALSLGEQSEGAPDVATERRPRPYADMLKKPAQ